MKISLKANLNGKILAYDYCAQLVYVMTSTIHMYTIFTYDIHNVLYECHGSNLQDTICHKVMTYAPGDTPV